MHSIKTLLFSFLAASAALADFTLLEDFTLEDVQNYDMNAAWEIARQHQSFFWDTLQRELHGIYPDIRCDILDSGLTYPLANKTDDCTAIEDSIKQYLPGIQCQHAPDDTGAGAAVARRQNSDPAIEAEEDKATEQIESESKKGNLLCKNPDNKGDCIACYTTQLNSGLAGVATCVTVAYAAKQENFGFYDKTIKVALGTCLYKTVSDTIAAMAPCRLRK